VQLLWRSFGAEGANGLSSKKECPSASLFDGETHDLPNSIFWEDLGSEIPTNYLI
jgi:hypothetical protein